MATYWENSCSFGLRYVSWYKYLIVSLVFSHLGFWSGNLFLIAPFPDLCLLVPFHPNDNNEKIHSKLPCQISIRGMRKVSTIILFLQTKDTIDPTCNVTNVVGTCNIGSDLCACVNHTWSMDVVVGDEGFGLRQIFPNGAGSNQSFTHDNFQVGHNISMGVIHASLGYVQQGKSQTESMYNRTFAPKNIAV